MRYMQIQEHINLETEVDVWNQVAYSAGENKVFIRIKCDEAVIQIDEHDLAKLWELVGLIKNNTGDFNKHKEMVNGR